jgi:hypothetical protein
MNSWYVVEVTATPRWWLWFPLLCFDIYQPREFTPHWNVLLPLCYIITHICPLSVRLSVLRHITRYCLLLTKVKTFRRLLSLKRRSSFLCFLSFLLYFLILVWFVLVLFLYAFFILAYTSPSLSLPVLYYPTSVPIFFKGTVLSKGFLLLPTL